MFKTGGITKCLIVLSCYWLIACGLNKSTRAPVDHSTSSVVQTGKLSIVQKLKEIDHLPVKERIALYHQLKIESPDRYNFRDETEITLYGYMLLWGNKVTEALEIFKLIVSEFPDSSNAFDSLGEGYLRDGDTTLSLANYAKSLALNPENFNAEDQIERIKFPNRLPQKPADKFAKVFPTNEYIADLDQLGRTLTKVHPNALKFISKAAFWKIIEDKKALITATTTYGEFAWHCSEVIASIKCSHTSMGSFNPENEMLPLPLRFPLQTRWVANQLYVIDALSNSGKVKKKDEIVIINGITVSQLISGIYKHISSQGFIQTTKKHFFNTWSTGLIPYALGFPETYRIVVKGRENAIVLNKAEAFKDPFNDPSIKHCDGNLCLDVLSDDKTAILTIASFNYYPWNNFDVFRKFIDSSFKELNRKGIVNLVIDVRLNGGGSQQSSIHLLRYLTEKPFIYYSNVQFKGKLEKIDGEEVVAPFENRFKGRLYFMMDGIGNSTTGHFMSLVKVFKLGTIVGEELGSNQFCSAGQTICRLANTKLVYYVADNTHESTATSLPDETGILPDHYVKQSIDDYLSGIDAVRKYTIGLIKAGK
jgi:hypothetical protein